MAAPGCGTGTGITGSGPAQGSGLGGLALSESQTCSVTHLAGVCVGGWLCDSRPRAQDLTVWGSLSRTLIPRGPCASRWAVPACPAHLSHVPGVGLGDWRRGAPCQMLLMAETGQTPGLTVALSVRGLWLQPLSAGGCPSPSPRPSVVQLWAGEAGPGRQGSWVPSVSLGRGRVHTPGP